MFAVKKRTPRRSERRAVASGGTVFTLRRCLIVSIFSSGLLFAQIDRANLNGTVTDVSGAVVPFATVEVVAQQTGLKRQTVSGSSGTFTITGLPIGAYDLTVAHSGFQISKVQGIELSVGQTRTVDLKLDVVGVSASVEVHATSEALERSDAQIGTVIETSQLRDIPVNGRNWATLMTLAPGAINVGGGSQTSIRFVGRSRDDNNYTFDGIDATGVQEQAL
jgi:hypothetical protein